MTRSVGHQIDHGRGAVAPSRAALREWYVSHLVNWHRWKEVKSPIQTTDDLIRRHDRWHVNDGDLAVG